MANEITGNSPPRQHEDIRLEKGTPHISQLNDVGLDDKVLNSEAQQATDVEHSFGVWQGLKTYKRAAFWSIGELRRDPQSMRASS